MPARAAGWGTVVSYTVPLAGLRTCPHCGHHNFTAAVLSQHLRLHDLHGGERTGSTSVPNTLTDETP